MTSLRVFAAGSFANFIVSFTIFFFTLLLLWPSVTYPGIIISDVDLSGPAALAGITPGMILSEINAIPITTTYNEYLNNTGYFYEEVGYLEIGDIVVVETIDDQIFEVELSNKTIEFFNETSEKEELFNATYMGINYSPRYKFAQSFLPFLIQLLTLISFFSLAVGIINILPIYPLDGGLMVEAITDKYAKKRSKQIVKTITFFVLIILLYSFFKPFL